MCEAFRLTNLSLCIFAIPQSHVNSHSPSLMLFFSWYNMKVQMHSDGRCKRLQLAHIMLMSPVHQDRPKTVNQLNKMEYTSTDDGSVGK